MRTILTLSLLLAACTDDPNTAPEIANLTASPLTVTTGMPAQVGGTLEFIDPDGDIDRVAISIKLPDGSVQDLPPGDVQGLTTQTEGTLSWLLAVTPPAPGAYELTLTLLDSSNLESNPLTVTVTAQ